MSYFWKVELLRPFWKGFQSSECLKGCQMLVVQIRYLQHKESSLFVWLIPLKAPGDMVLVLSPCLMCHRKLANFSDFCNIMHCSRRKLQEICKKCKVLENSGKRLLICQLFLQEMSVEQIRRILERLFQETSKIFGYFELCD